MKNVTKIFIINLAVLIFLASLLEIVLTIGFPVPTYLMNDHGELASVAGWGPTTKKNGYEPACDNVHSFDPNNPKIRVLTLGDSLLDCNEAGSQPYEITIPSLLAKSLGASWDVYNLAAGGWGTDQEYLAYLAVKAKYKPDWVILFYTPANDLYNNSSSKAIFENIAKPIFLLQNDTLKVLYPESKNSGSPKKRLLLKTEIGKRLFLLAHRYGFATGHNEEVKDSVKPASVFESEAYSHMATSFIPFSPRFQQSWKVTQRVLIEFNKEVKRSGAKFAVVYIPTGIRNLCEPLKEYPSHCIGYGEREVIPVICNGEVKNIAPYYQYNLIRELGLKEGFPVIEGFSDFKPYAARHNLLAKDCIHFNHSVGAQFLVNRLSDFLNKNRFVRN